MALDASITPSGASLAAPWRFALENSRPHFSGTFQEELSGAKFTVCNTFALETFIYMLSGASHGMDVSAATNTWFPHPQQQVTPRVKLLPCYLS